MVVQSKQNFHSVTSMIREQVLAMLKVVSWGFTIPTGSEEREVLLLGGIPRPVAILLSCQDIKNIAL